MKTCLLYATCDRTELLLNSLERLMDRTLPDEILVVDDGGTSPGELFETLEAWKGDHGLPLRYVRTENPGQTMCSHARNVGINSTDADVVITSEPEMLLDTDAVAQLLADLEDPRYENCAINAGVVHLEQAPGTTCGCCGQRYHTVRNWEATWVTAYRREWLLAVGGWDETFPEPWGWDDTDLLTRLRISGIGKYNDPAIEATHQWHPPTYLPQTLNEAHFAAKGFNGDERKDHPELVANRAAIEAGTWGVPRGLDA